MPLTRPERPPRDTKQGALIPAMLLIAAAAFYFFAWSMQQDVSADRFFTSAGFIFQVPAFLLIPLRWQARPLDQPEPPGTGCATSLRAALSILCFLASIGSCITLDGFLFARETRPYTRAGAFFLTGSTFLYAAMFLFVRSRQFAKSSP